MLNAPSRAAPKLPRNEIFRAVIAIPADATLYGGTQYIAVVWDHCETAHSHRFPFWRPSILGNDDNSSLPYLPGYRLIDLLCRDRAMSTVDGELRVCDRQVEPEDYLGMWRHALTHPKTPSWLADERGLCILIRLGGALEPARASISGWSGSPFPTFAEFEAAYGSRFMPSGTSRNSQRFDLVLDLREPNAARDAFYAQSLLLRCKSAAGSVSVSLAYTSEGDRACVQGLLFEESLP